MTALEGIIGLIASVIAIIGAIFIAVRYLGRKLDKWANTIIENSTAMRDLTHRVSTLEGAINTLKSVMTK